jgi:hypothetical protein
MPLGQRFGGARRVSSGENVARRAGSNEHQVIATEPEQAERAGSRTRGRPVSRQGGLFHFPVQL